jgi:asparagine synthase (glutamine-hydrolysing)
MRSWLRSWFETRGGAREWLRSTDLPGIDTDALAGLIEDDLREGLNRERLLYAIVLLAEWQRLAVRGKAMAHAREAVAAAAV